MINKLEIKIGNFSSFGCSLFDERMFFTFVCKGKAAVVFFDITSKEEVLTVPLEPEFRRGDVYSVSIKGLDARKFCYLYSDGEKTFTDPYATSIIGRETWGDGNESQIYCGLAEPGCVADDFTPPKANELIIYKCHLRGLTMARGGVNAGNYKAFIAQIPRLKKLGINCVELFPIYEFNEISKDYKTNYWGYGDDEPFYLAPKASYFGKNECKKHALELINALHKAGIAVIMEFCFIDRCSFDIIHAVRYWAHNYKVDGFKFIGTGIPKEKLIHDPFLSDKFMLFEDISCKVREDDFRLICENDSFLYATRRLLNQMDGSISEFANLFLTGCKGSPGSESAHRINYAAKSNGFTLYDSFSYYDKHNEENGENNSDGNNYNCSHNCGAEGDTRDKVIIKRRLQRIRTALACVFLSRGIPMITAGDEMLNSQAGNNNPYCQDNMIGWVNYTKKKDAVDLIEYIRKLIEFRRMHPILSSDVALTMNDYKRLGIPDASYHGKEPWSIGINEYEKSLGILLNGAYTGSDEDVMLLFNFYNDAETMAIPKISGKKWYQVSCTDSFDFDEKLLKAQDMISVPGGAVTVLVAR